MRTMSDFIMESEISDLELNGNAEVEVMESFMRMTAVAGVAECYCEHAAIAEFAESEGLSVFSESDDNIAKKAWSAVKSFFEQIWEWLKAIVKAVIQMITRSSLEKLIAKIRTWRDRGTDDEGHKFDINAESGVPAVIIDAESVLALVEEFSEYIKAGYDKDTLNDKLDNFTKSAKDLVEKYKKTKKAGGGDKTGYREDVNTYTRSYDIGGGETETETETYTSTRGSRWSEVLATLERMQKNNTASSAHKLLKSLDFKKKEWKAEGAEKADNSDVKKVKEAAKWIAKAYDKYTSYTVKLVQKILKKQLKEERLSDLQGSTAALKTVQGEGGDAIRKKATKESYVENSDGYFFL